MTKQKLDRANEIAPQMAELEKTIWKWEHANEMATGTHEISVRGNEIGSIWIRFIPSSFEKIKKVIIDDLKLALRLLETEFESL